MSKVSAIFVAQGAASTIQRSLESFIAQRSSSELELVVILGEGESELPEAARGALGELEPKFIVSQGQGRAALWNEALGLATGDLLSFMDAGQILADGAYEKLSKALTQDDSIAGSFGRTAVIDDEATLQQHPDGGKTGRIFNRLVEKKHYFGAFPCVLFRASHFEGGFNEIYNVPRVAFLEHALHVSNLHPFAYVDEVVATAPNETEDYPALEEFAKLFVAILYGSEELDERGEQKVRKRLARHLVALGKYHYRRGEFERAGRFIDQAVKINPTYFKGRRYQFLNFVKDLLSRS